MAPIAANRLNDADLVIGVHHADQDGFGQNGGAETVEIEAAIGLGREDRDAKAGAFEVTHGIEHGLMLGGHGDDDGAAGDAGACRKSRALQARDYSIRWRRW